MKLTPPVALAVPAGVTVARTASGTPLQRAEIWLLTYEQQTGRVVVTAAVAVEPQVDAEQVAAAGQRSPEVHQAVLMVPLTRPQKAVPAVVWVVEVMAVRLVAELAARRSEAAWETEQVEMERVLQIEPEPTVTVEV